MHAWRREKGRGMQGCCGNNGPSYHYCLLSKYSCVFFTTHSHISCFCSGKEVWSLLGKSLTSELGGVSRQGGGLRGMDGESFGRSRQVGDIKHDLERTKACYNTCHECWALSISSVFLPWSFCLSIGLSLCRFLLKSGGSCLLCI